MRSPRLCPGKGVLGNRARVFEVLLKLFELLMFSEGNGGKVTRGFLTVSLPLALFGCILLSNRVGLVELMVTLLE